MSWTIGNLIAATGPYTGATVTAAAARVLLGLGTIATINIPLDVASGGTGTNSWTNITLSLINFVGDSGAGGVKGAVPAPAAGDAAAGKFLKADGTWAVPPGSASTPPGLIPEIDLKSTGVTNFTVPNSQTINPERVVFRLTTKGGTYLTGAVVSVGVSGNATAILDHVTLFNTTLLSLDVFESAWLKAGADAGTTTLSVTVHTAATGSGSIKSTPLVLGECF